MDINALIAEAVRQQQQQMMAHPLIQGGPMMPPSPGQPIIGQDVLQEAMARAMLSRQPNTGQDVNSAMGRIGAALMQPRMPGESVAGNFGKAMQGGQSFLEGRQDAAQKLAMEQAQLASTMATADTVRRNTEMNMKIMATKFPVEYAKLQQELRDAVNRGDVTAKQAIEAKLALANGGELLAQEIKQRLEKGSADIARVQSQTQVDNAQVEASKSHSRYWDAMAGYYEAGKPSSAQANKPTVLKTEDLGDGRRLTTFQMNGRVYHEILRPGIPDAATAQKMAKRQLEQEGKYGWFKGSQKDIDQRAAELMQNRSVVIDVVTGQPVNPKQLQQPTPPPAPGVTAPAPGATSGQVSGAAVKARPNEITQATAILNKEIASMEQELQNSSLSSIQRKELEDGIAQRKAQLVDMRTPYVASENGPDVHGNLHGGTINVASPGAPSVQPASVATPAKSNSGKIFVRGPDGRPMPSNLAERRSSVPGQEAPTTQKQATSQQYQDKVLSLGAQYEKNHPKLRAWRTLMMSKDPTTAASAYQDYYRYLEKLVGQIDLD